MDRLRQYMDLGVNRFSVGVQACPSCTGLYPPVLTPCKLFHSLTLALDSCTAKLLGSSSLQRRAAAARMAAFRCIRDVFVRATSHRLVPPAQAFQQPLLEACGRSHSLDEARAALDAVRAAGPRSWSLDLISGLPGLTRGAWRESLSAAIAAEPPHISVYDLQVDRAPLHHSGWSIIDVVTIAPDVSRAMLSHLCRRLHRICV